MFSVLRQGSELAKERKMSQPHAEGHGEEGPDVSEKRRARPSIATVEVVANFLGSQYT